MEGNEHVRLGRRALLTAGAAGVAAAAAQAIAAPAKVLAADHDPVKIGEANEGSKQTFLHSATDNAFVATSQSKNGLTGGSDAAGQSGCYAWTSNPAGFGLTARNTASLNSAQLAGPYIAVSGEGHGLAAAIYGTHVAGGWGVKGQNSKTGYFGGLGGSIAAVSAYAPNDGFGLTVYGKVSFSRSGILTIGVGKQSASVSNVAVTGTSFVIATLVGYRSGVWVAGAVPNVAASSITIYLNKKVTSAVKVGWIVLDKQQVTAA